MNRFYRLGMVMAMWSAVSAVALAQDPAVYVRVADVERQMLQQRHAVTGSLRAVARGEVAALEPGELLELRVREGERVQKGEILARIDSRRLEALKAETEAEGEVAKAELARAKATLVQAEADVARARQLIAQKAVSQQNLDAAEAAHGVAIANVDAAKQRILRIAQSIRLLDVRLEDMVIRAPYDASVITRHVEPGDWVQAGESLLTVVSTGPIEAWLEVPERFVEALDRYGDAVVVRPRATGRANRVISTKRVAEVNPRVRTVPFVVLLENSDGLLSEGMSVDGWIAVTGETLTNSVPKDAVMRTNGQPFVYRIDNGPASTTAQRIPVQVLFETADRVAVEAIDLRPGDQVIVEGNERLLPGQSVVVTSSDPSRSMADK